MGANIGTTLSAWIMSAGFSFNIANLVWPAFLIGIILIQIGKHRYIGDFLFGISFLLFALGMLNQTGRDMDLASNPAVVNFFASFDSGSYGTILLFLLIGAILTCIAQSSAGGDVGQHTSPSRGHGSPAVQRIRRNLGTDSVLPVRTYRMPSGWH